MTLLTHYDPFAELSGLNRWLEKDFSRAFPSRLQRDGGPWNPSVDILENENDFVIKVELPEVEEKAIDMKIEKSVLTVKGERRMEDEETKKNYRRMERRYGSFQRSFRLPDSVDTDKITARLKQGLLKIVLPKKEETKPRNIKVNSK